MKTQIAKFKNMEYGTNSILFLLVLSAFIFFNSCKKEGDRLAEELSLVEQLPPATESGEDMFACILNNVVWIAEDGCCGTSKLIINYDDNGNYVHGEYTFSILGFRSTNWGFKLERLKFHLEPIKEKGLVDFSTLQVGKVTYEIEEFDPYVVTTYQMNEDSDVHFEITKLDSVQKICSGNFSFHLTNIDNDTDRVTVSHGRFDGIYGGY